MSHSCTALLLLLLFPLTRSVLAQDPAPRKVVLLLHKQWIGMGRGYDRFCKRNADRKRSELRKRALRELKKIAAAEQPAVLEALSHPPGARSLWIVNAIAASLTQEQIEKARRLAAVQFIYPAGRMVPRGPAGKVATVIEGGRPDAFRAKGKKIPWNLKLLKVPRVWSELKITGEGTVVAMFDTGINYTLDDLRHNIWINPGEVANNGKDDDGNGWVDDYYGFDFANMRAEVMARQNHGSWTASVVAGDGTDGMVTGVAPRARLMAIRAPGGTYNAALAFQYAIENGADIVNMSFSQPGLGHTRGLWRLLSEQASAAGLVLVSGAGNFPGQKIPVQIRIPEGIPCVICAGGVTARNKFARFTSRGPVEWGSVKFYGDFPMPKGLVKPDVCAFPGPGIGLVHPTQPGYLPDHNPRRGNSLSAPHVAGVCALILSARPELTPWRVKAILEQTARDLLPRGKDVETGAGLVDAFRAVKAALK